MQKKSYEHDHLKCPLCGKPLRLSVYMRAYGPSETPLEEYAFGDLRFHVYCGNCFLEQDRSLSFHDPRLKDEDETMEEMTKWVKKHEHDWARLCKAVVYDGNGGFKWKT